MSKEKIKVYLYTRVSTNMQMDGYSLDAQKTKMKAFCDYNEYEIAGEYEDAGKSGKSIEGRVSFNQMMEDIKSGKDGVSYVLVFKLSRFGRNAADVLATLQVMQDFGVNLICVEDGIDSSKDAGKLMISVLSAVAEIERENIRVQTMEGRMQKAREGKWNGGFAPYGYALIDGKLVVNEEEAVAIRTIFDQYVNTDLGVNGIAKYLENHGIHKIARQNGKNPLFDAALIRRIIQNPVYSGKISYGRRRTEKVHGTRNEYRQVKKDDYLLVDGLHKALVSEEVWEQAQVKVAAQAKKYEKVNRDKKEKIHLLSGILKCPVCGAGMYGNKAIKKLITYASGKSADIVIWVVKRAREEHRAAIEWLNNHTDENIAFFLVETKLYQIGTSDIAVKFEVVEKPNDWTKEIKRNISHSTMRKLSWNSNPAQVWISTGEYNSDYWHLASAGCFLLQKIHC